MQSTGETQSAADVHELLQTLVPHSYGEQERASGVMQLPAPSQVEAGVNIVVPLGQLEPKQVVPCTYFWQLPWPSHLPLVPHFGAPLSRQVPWGSETPAATLVQVPSAFGRAHDWQAPEQAVLQQIPCAQNLLAHSAAARQEAPMLLRPQEELASQALGASHWSLVAQLLKHAVPLQT